MTVRWEALKIRGLDLDARSNLGLYTRARVRVVTAGRGQRLDLRPASESIPFCTPKSSPSPPPLSFHPEVVLA